ncbi:MAG TPA: IS256 family transposase [Acidimicrobiales bacterium]|nr:IS256 family transposase [Acidimicrobiales bacterium]
MSPRVSPLERIRADIDAAFASERDLGEVLEEVARLGVRLLMQSAIEAEVTTFLGRERYSHGDRARAGSRNGHCPTTVKTTAGPVTIERPKLRGTEEAFASRLFGKGVVRTNALESLVIAGFVRGLSVRDVEATLADALGPEAALSKSTVSRVCKAIKTEFDAWKARDLSDVHLEYLFLDGSHFRFHEGSRAEPVLAAWGITTEGTPVLVGLEPGASESTDAWAEFLNGMVTRGLRAPLLVVSDGAPGLIAAVELVFPTSLRQRCAIHRARNILAKVPKEHQEEVKAAYWGIFDATGEPPGEKSVAVARQRAEDFSVRFGRQFPAAVTCLNDDLASLFTYLRFPDQHHHRIRHSNFIERTFGETRRRVKVIGRLPGERSCLSLVWAVLDRASRGWRGVTMTPAIVRQLQELRRQLLDPPAVEKVTTTRKKRVVTAAA